MKKRDKKKEQKDILKGIAMIMQIGFSIMTCMALSFAIGYYIDQRFHLTVFVPIMLLVGILASIRSMLILTGGLTRNPHKEADDEESKNHPL